MSGPSDGFTWRATMRSTKARSTRWGALCALPLILDPAPVMAAASLDPLTDACGVAYHQSTKPPEAVVWASRNGNRIVLLGVKGDRFECLFGNDQKPVPELISVETTAPDKSVTVLTGKTLGKLNALIAQQLSVLSKPPMITKD